MGANTVRVLIFRVSSRKVVAMERNRPLWTPPPSVAVTTQKTTELTLSFEMVMHVVELIFSPVAFLLLQFSILYMYLCHF